MGSALTRALRAAKSEQIVTRTFSQLDLRSQQAVESFFAQEQPTHVYVAAAKVGGIKANSEQPASFLYDNLMIASNVIHAAHKYGVEKLLFLGSSCIYPRLCQQPMKEEYLLSGPLEPTNEPYAIAKIAGLKLCQSYNRQYQRSESEAKGFKRAQHNIEGASHQYQRSESEAKGFKRAQHNIDDASHQFGARFISAMPTNLYGPNDQFNTESSHVIPALITKFHQAKIEGRDQVILWGTGNALREFLFVDDLAQALLLLMDQYDENQWINVGSGQEVSIAELAELIKTVTGFAGRIVFDSTKPDGAPRKLLCSAKIQALGWRPKVSLEQGLRQTYDWFLMNNALNIDPSVSKRLSIQEV